MENTLIREAEKLLCGHAQLDHLKDEILREYR